ncbi:hypothetical protein Dda3937_03129 [Dickeya dadantii 3937]|uniref:Uncharacterized protein n=1 Tax=Dickeya dadantii (strain 3937) TaxID=198628 RepID=E0SFX9_DICD3|nr:hypothetical protein Dda3937_03129 [Dickeya dadantii 3937]
MASAAGTRISVPEKSGVGTSAETEDPQRPQYGIAWQFYYVFRQLHQVAERIGFSCYVCDRSLYGKAVFRQSVDQILWTDPGRAVSRSLP